MRRLLALGVGCLLSVSAYSEDLLTIFDQAVVNDPLVRDFKSAPQLLDDLLAAHADLLPQF